MFKTILVTTDFSANSAVAVRPAIEIACRFEGKLVLVHALEGGSEEAQVAAEELAELAAMAR